MEHRQKKNKKHQHWPQGDAKMGAGGRTRERMQSYPQCMAREKMQVHRNRPSEAFAKLKKENQLLHYTIVFTSTVNQQDIMPSDCSEVH